MLDKVSDFFKDIKERLSNPFLSSFLTAWCIFNWRIVICLVFYKQSELKADGYTSFIDLVVKNLDILHNLILPFLSGFTYTFIFPFFRNWILIASAWYKAWGNHRVLQVSRAGSISVQKYMVLREKYLAGIDQFVELVKSEEKYVINNAELKKELATSLTELHQERQRLKNWDHINSKAYFEGEWYIKIKKNTHLATPSLSAPQEDETKFIDFRVASGIFKFETSIKEFNYPDTLVINKVVSDSRYFYLDFKNGRFILQNQQVSILWELSKVEDKDKVLQKETYAGYDHIGNTILIEKK